MSKQMIVNASASEEIRVAIVENNRLVDLDIETQSRTKQKGNIYKGIVANVEDSLEAAFIEFGEDKQGFLALAEIRPALYPSTLKDKRKPKISEILTRGQEIIVQVTKDEIGQKGAAVTTYLSLPGRYVVLMHSDDGGGAISRKIDDENARRRARDLLSRLEVPEGMAVIIRTAGMNRSRIDLYRDLRALCRTWEQIDRGGQLGRAPTLLYREPDLVIRTIRDYLSPDITRIVLDAEEEFEDARSYLEERMPDSMGMLELHRGHQPVFEAHGIERAIEELFHREVKLPSGGSIVIDQAEALVAIDVNSGRSTREQDHEATVYKTNLEAAAEIARQLRLRDLGGIIVVDFIDMVSKRHERDVERAIKDAMRADKAKVKIGRISENGTLEITRQRLRQAHRLVSFSPCPHCEGTGIVRAPEGLAIGALRQIQARLANSKRDLARVVVKVPLAVANVLSNTKRTELVALSEQHGLQLDVLADTRLQGSEIKFEEEARGRAGLNAHHGVKDPRLDNDRGRRRGRRGRDPDPVLPLGQSQPPPTIGPVPTFLVDEEALIGEPEILDEEPVVQERAPVAAEKRAPVVDEHFEDPIEEALFGSPPALAIEEIEVPRVVIESEAAAEGGPSGKKKRRRRRSRRRKGGGDEQAAAEVGAPLGDDEADGDETSDEGEAVSGEGTVDATLVASAEGAPVEAAGHDDGAADSAPRHPRRGDEPGEGDDGGPRRGRRRRRSEADPHAADGESNGAHAEGAAGSDDLEASADGEEGGRPSRRSRRPRRAPKDADVQPESPAE